MRPAGKSNLVMAQWAKGYQAALRTYLGQGPRSTLRPALDLGAKASALGLETLDVARIHEQALKALVLPGGAARSRTRTRILSRTLRFFEETLVPIEQTHRAAKEDVRRVTRLSEELRTRTAESDDSTRRLEQGVVRRKEAETALGKSDELRDKLLAESRALEKSLQGQMRKILTAQENERRKSSHELQNEIAQVLVAIHVRLLTLKEAVHANTDSLKNEIAETQELVKQSVMTIRRLGHESSVHHEA